MTKQIGTVCVVFTVTEVSQVDTVVVTKQIGTVCFVFTVTEVGQVDT